jgi:hypothetical protein
MRKQAAQLKKTAAQIEETTARFAYANGNAWSIRLQFSKMILLALAQG